MCQNFVLFNMLVVELLFKCIFIIIFNAIVFLFFRFYLQSIFYNRHILISFRRCILQYFNNLISLYIIILLIFWNGLFLKLILKHENCCYTPHLQFKFRFLFSIKLILIIIFSKLCRISVNFSLLLPNLNFVVVLMFRWKIVILLYVNHVSKCITCRIASFWKIKIINLNLQADKFILIFTSSMSYSTLIYSLLPGICLGKF